jgi:hypothetical protein
MIDGGNDIDRDGSGNEQPLILLSDIHRRIRRVRRKERSVRLLTGLARTVFSLLGGVLMFFVLDVLCDPPFWARWTGVALVVAWCGWTFRKRLWQQMRRGPDDDEIALRIESRFPELQGGLISTLQLRRAMHRDPGTCSEELLKALEDETFRIAAPLDFRTVVRRGPLWLHAALAALALALGTGCFFSYPDHARALALRLRSARHVYPTRTRILRVAAPSFVARGDGITVRVSVDESGRIPEEAGTLRFISRSDGVTTPVRLVREGGGDFAGRLPQAFEDVSIEIRVGDARRQGPDVKVLTRPEVAGGQVRYRYPAYTGRAVSPPEPFGHLSALRGSSAEIALHTTKPLRKACIQMQDGALLTCVRTDDAGRSWKLKEPMPIDRNGSFRVLLKDRIGLTNAEPRVIHNIEAAPDLPPTVRLLHPDRDCSVTAKAVPTVRFVAEDDFKVSEVWLAYRIRRAEDSGVRKKTERVDIGLRGEFSWDLYPLNLRVGDEVLFWIEVDDACKANDRMVSNAIAALDEPGSVARGVSMHPRSMDVKLTVVDPGDKALEVDSELMEVLKRLKHAKRDQDALKKSLEQWLEKYGGGD